MVFRFFFGFIFACLKKSCVSAVWCFAYRRKTCRGFGTERARLGTFRGFDTERTRLGNFLKISKMFFTRKEQKPGQNLKFCMKN